MSLPLLADRILAITAVIGAAVIVEYGWSHYPRPVEGGGLILGTVAALAAARVLHQGSARRPMFRRVVLAIASILVAQALLQAGASFGWI